MRSLLGPLGTTLGRMEGVNTNPKDGPAARYGYGASIDGSAAARPLRRACALWWVLVRYKGMHCQSGSAHDPRGSHAPLGIPPSHPRRWFRFGAFLATFVLACWGIPAPKGQNNGFPRPGRNQRSIGPERCGPGPPNEHFGWAHRWFGRAQHLS